MICQHCFDMQVYLAIHGATTEWENKFLLSVNKNLTKLSPKQFTTLNNILKKYFPRDSFHHDAARCRASRQSKGESNETRDFHAYENKELRERAEILDAERVQKSAV